MVGAKYFVWGEGVWREVDVSSGRVAGWRRRARFVFVRRGRLQLARRRGVLRALRALAAGQAGAAADGARLSHRSKSVLAATKPQAAPAPLPAACEHHHCCSNLNGYNNAFKEPNPAATPLLPQQGHDAGTQCGRKEVGTSTDGRHSITINMRQAARVTHSTQHSSGEDFITTPTRAHQTKPPVTYNSRTEVNELLGKQTATHISRTSPSETSHTRRESQKSDVVKTSAERADLGRTAKPKQKPRFQDTSSEDRASSGKTASKSRKSLESAAGVCKELIIPEEDVAALRAFVSRRRASAVARFDSDDEYKRALFYAINPLVEVERCARLERALAERHAAALPHFAARLGLARRAGPPAPPAARPAPPPARPAPPRRPARRRSSADHDKENKQHSRATSSRGDAGQPRGVGGDADEDGARTTRSGATPRGTERDNKRAANGRVIKPAAASTTTSGEDDTDEETDSDAALRKPRVRTSRRPVERPADTREPALKKNKESLAEHSSNVERPGEQPALKQRKKPAAGDARAPHVISQRPSAAGKEYSNLEDHAIVAWVSAGARASLVNGNRLWRELQADWPRLTGRARSWHSLRNRYLRYVLPALHALQLPPAQESRLRAAAATGAIKSKARAARGAQRRNSIFAEAPLGAASRRPRPPPSPPSSAPSPPSPARPPPSPAPSASSSDLADNDHTGAASPRRSLRSRAAEEEGAGGLARSPRYSEVTRRFAARRRRRSSSSPPPSPPSPPPAPRARRLYNPHA